MKAAIILFILGYLISLQPLLAQVTSNDAQYFIEYQGILTDSTGRPASDTIHLITIRLYADPEGSATPIWQDDFMTATKGGVFTVMLGSHIPLPKPLGPSLWIGISSGMEKPELVVFTPSPSSFKVTITDNSRGSTSIPSGNKFNTKLDFNQTLIVSPSNINILTGDILPKPRLLTQEEIDNLRR